MKKHMNRLLQFLMGFSVIVGSLSMSTNVVKAESEESEKVSDPYVSLTFNDETIDEMQHSEIVFWGPNSSQNRNNSKIEYGLDDHGNYMRWESTCARGGGFKVFIDKELTEYSIGLKFCFDRTDNGWRKIIDYKDSESDTGFYFHENGKIRFYPEPQYGSIVVRNNEVVDIIVTRKNGSFIVDLVQSDGSCSKVFESTDSKTIRDSIPHYTSDGKTLFGFFFDDIKTSSEATPGGRVYKLSIWDHPIDAKKVVTEINKKDNEKYDAKVSEPIKVNDPENLSEEDKQTIEQEIRKQNPLIPSKANIGVEDNLTAKIVYPDRSETTIDISDLLVKKMEADHYPIGDFDIVKVNDINNLSEEEIKAVHNAILNAIPEFTNKSDVKIEVKANGSVKATYPDGSIIDLEQVKTVKNKTMSEKYKVHGFEPIIVENLSSLSNDEKKKINDAFVQANEGISDETTSQITYPKFPAGTTVNFIENKGISVQFSDGSKTLLKLNDIARLKVIADDHKLIFPSPITVEKMDSLTEQEKDKIKKEVLSNNKNLPDDAVITIENDGTVKVKFSDNSESILKPEKTITKKHYSSYDDYDWNDLLHDKKNPNKQNQNEDSSIKDGTTNNSGKDQTTNQDLSVPEAGDSLNYWMFVMFILGLSGIYSYYRFHQLKKD